MASGENEFCVVGFKYLFDQKAVDIAMLDIGRVGGI
jgi:L-alanine-DL-glutamate epimerase-like enolase superfamily enzyme